MLLTSVYRFSIIFGGLIIGPTLGWSFEIVKGAPMMALESPSGATECQAWDLNDDGSLIVGECDGLPVRWVNGLPKILDGQEQVVSGRAVGTNTSGEIVGNIQTGADLLKAAIWNDQSQVWEALPTGDSEFSDARDISDNGFVVGRLFGDPPAFTPVPVLWNQGQIIQLQEPIDSTNCLPYAVNNSGQTAGRCFAVDANNDFIEVAILWNADASIGLELGSGNPGASTFGRGINAAGNVAGVLGDAAALWTAPNYLPTILAALGAANSINDSGDAVGFLGVNGGDPLPSAVIWRAGSTVAEPLGSLGGSFSWARAINTQGMIVGFSNTEADVLDELEAFIVWPDDRDGDDDGVPDAADLCPGTAGNDPVDANGCSDAQVDGDGDGVCDPGAPSAGPSSCMGEDAFPDDPSESSDNDGDMIGDNSDPDDDNDGQTDADEVACGSDPLSATSLSPDTDGDSTPDCVDLDDDNDGVDDGNDVCPDTTEEAPTSSRGLGKNRWALLDSISDFTQAPPQEGSMFSFTTTDTRGCSCSQIVEAAGNGNNHLKRGCSTSVMLDWINDP